MQTAFEAADTYHTVRCMSTKITPKQFNKRLDGKYLTCHYMYDSQDNRLIKPAN